MKATAANVARGLTLAQYADLQEQAERLRACQEREAKAGQQGKKKPLSGAVIGRPEYRSLANALAKERLYAQAQEAEARARREAEGRLARWLDAEARKARRLEAWLDFDPEAAPVSLSHLPSF